MAASVAFPLEFLPNLDQKIDQLVANIVKKLRFGPPEADVEIRDALSSTTLRIKNSGTYDVNALSMLGADGRPFISIGRGLYPFVQQYTSCAAAYFLPGEANGIRPSSSWPIARDGLAASLEALAIPDTEPPSSNVQLSEQQAERALIFGNYAFRFIICHEMAHLALGHIRPGLLSSREIDGEIRATLSARHDSELAADRFGFTLHMKALESPLLVVTALAAVIYFLLST